MADSDLTRTGTIGGGLGAEEGMIELSLERSKIAAALEEERARLQERFISHVSHELRTPLTAIYFFTTNLLDGLLGELTPDQREHLTLALDNVEQLKEMVNDLLDITRIDTKKLAIEQQPASLARLVAGVLNTCLTNAGAKNINLRSDVALGLPFLWAEPARVRQILINLIDNGIKFTPDGGTVRVEAKLLPVDDGFLRISVSDNGCGISSENCGCVFDRLALVSNSGEPSRSGLGLGLFLAKELVLLHGGRIWVESQLGKGSTFHFTLPVFSLAKLWRPLFTVSDLGPGCVTVIAVDVIVVEGAAQCDLSLEIRNVLQSCIHVDSDLLLPSMSDAETVISFFIVSCTDASGAAGIVNRIRGELPDFETALAYTTLVTAARGSLDEQVSELSEQIERLIQTHLNDRERLAG